MLLPRQPHTNGRTWLDGLPKLLRMIVKLDGALERPRRLFENSIGAPLRARLARRRFAPHFKDLTIWSCVRTLSGNGAGVGLLLKYIFWGTFE